MSRYVKVCQKGRKYKSGKIRYNSIVKLCQTATWRVGTAFGTATLNIGKVRFFSPHLGPFGVPTKKKFNIQLMSKSEKITCHSSKNSPGFSRLICMGHKLIKGCDNFFPLQAGTSPKLTILSQPGCFRWDLEPRVTLEKIVSFYHLSIFFSLFGSFHFNKSTKLIFSPKKVWFPLCFSWVRGYRISIRSEIDQKSRSAKC